MVPDARDSAERLHPQGSEAWWRSLVQHASDLLLVFDARSKIVYASPSVERVLGYRVDEIVGKPMPGRPAERDPHVANVYEAVMTTPRSTARYEAVVVAADGSEHLLSCALTNLLDDPAVRGLVVNAHDVTDRWRAAQERRDVEQAVVWQAEILEMVATGAPLANTLRAIDRIAAADTEARHAPLLARLRDIAVEHRRFEDALAHQSLHDDLTRLPNRTLFLDRLAFAMGRAHRIGAGLAVLLVDIDGFKVVNDSLGHATGDRILAACGDRLASVVRPGDTLARFGGDEFVLLCDDLPSAASADSATDIATRVLEALAPPFHVEGVELFLHASVGIAVMRAGHVRAEDLVRDADAATYRAKELGRARWVVFDDTLRQRDVAEHTILNELHRAVARDELRVFFQPVVALDDERCVGAEALVRWQHPERGLVGPGEFIALAEQSDLVVDLGEWVLAETARRAATWHGARGAPCTVSVNLSGRQLALPDLASRVARILGEAGCPPERLCLEITESVLMSDADRAVAAVDSLRALGVHVAIDDFGTGYSSLAYLKRFSVDSVKVDRSFVDGLGRDPNDRAIVAAVVSMAHALGLRVVAEGVEHDVQLAELVALGCDEAQGYLFARPAPVLDLVELERHVRTRAPQAFTQT